MFKGEVSGCRPATSLKKGHIVDPLTFHEISDRSLFSTNSRTATSSKWTLPYFENFVCILKQLLTFPVNIYLFKADNRNTRTRFIHCLKSVRIRSYSGLHFRIWTEYGEILPISPYLVRMLENADQNNRYVNVQSWKNLMRQSKEIKKNWIGPKHFDICFCLTFNCYDKSFISEMETWQSRTASCTALLIPKQNYIKMWCSIVLFHKIFWKYMSIIGDYYNH